MMPTSRRLERDEQPDLMVTATVFVGLLVFFMSMTVIFVIGTPAAVPKNAGRSGNEAIKLRYFATWSEAIFVLPEKVVFPDDPAGPFEVAFRDVPNNPRIKAYFADLAANQARTESGTPARRRPMIGVHPAATFNEFWIEAMSGDAGVGSVSILRFHPLCTHILRDDPKGRELYEKCIARSQGRKR